MSTSQYGLFIISFNRVFVLKRALKSFQKFFKNQHIYIIDKGSDYTPLLEYYLELQKAGINIIYSTPMLSGADGPGGLNDIHIEIDKFKDDFQFYAVTDPDISIENCDTDFLSTLSEMLDAMPEIDIAGPMLKIDDIPEEYPAREFCFTRHVEQFWHKAPKSIFINNKDVYYQEAPIDSTFGLLRSATTFKRLLNGVRLYNPYEGLHLDWYITPDTITDDQKNYMDKSNQNVSHWGARLFKEQPLFSHILTKKEREIYSTSYIEKNNKVQIIKLCLPTPDIKYIYLRNFLSKINTDYKKRNIQFKKYIVGILKNK